jgi:REP element-mobilizing transposase RayT
LHGDESGSVDRNHNVPGHRVVETDEARASRERELMDQPPYLLNASVRGAVLNAIQEVCSHRQWSLLAVHVRTNHVHAIVEAEARPEKVMNDFKSYASRRLNRTSADGRDRKRWARHGSTRWLWNRDDVGAAVRYVVEEQGEPMAVFVA